MRAFRHTRLTTRRLMSIEPPTAPCLMILRILVALLALVIATRTVASMELSVPLRELYSMSSVVAVVEVLEGQVVAAGGETCGARYKGRVIEGTKNATVGQFIEFGFVPSLKIGSNYFVLLDEYKNVPVERIPDFQSRCKNVLPDLALVGRWRGAMEVTSSAGAPERRDAWTVRPANRVVYPVGTRGEMVGGERQLVFSDMVNRMKQASPYSR